MLDSFKSKNLQSGVGEHVRFARSAEKAENIGVHLAKT